MRLVEAIKRTHSLLKTEQAKLCSLILLAIVILVGAVVLTTPHIFSDFYLKQQLIRTIGKSTGHALRISGDIKAELLPWPTITAHEVSLESGTAPEKSAPIFQAKTLIIELKPIALILGAPRAQQITLQGAEITLRVNKQGRPEWLTKDQSNILYLPNEKFSYLGSFFDLFSLVPYNRLPARTIIKNAIVSYHNTANGQKNLLKKLDNIIDFDDSNGMMKLRGAALVNGIASDWSLLVNNTRSLYTVERSHIEGSYTNDLFSFSVDGFIERNTYNGRLDLSVNSLAKMHPDTMQIPPLNQINSPLELTMQNRNILCERYTCYLNRGSYTLDRISGNIQGEISFERPVPYFKLNIDANKTNLNQLLRTRRKHNRRKAAIAPWRIPLSKQELLSKENILPKLPAIDLDIVLQTKKLFINRYRLNDTIINLRMNQHLLDIALKDSNVFDGTVDAQLTINMHQQPAQWLAIMDLKSVNIDEALKKLTNLHFVSGNADIRSHLSASGNTWANIIHSLSGNGSFDLKYGNVASADFGDMFRNVNDAFNKVRRSLQSNSFKSLYGKFSVKNGVVTNEDLTFISNFLQFKGKGKLDLPNYSTEYIFLPERVIKLDQFAGIKNKYNYPILVSGSIDDMQMKPDLKHPIENRRDSKKHNKKAKK